jgi:Carboxypeptidase regulatory-like domain
MMGIRLGTVAAVLAVLAFSRDVLDAQSGGTIAGTVTTKAAPTRTVRVTMDERVCGNEVADEGVVTDSAGRVANAVVMLIGVKGRPNPAAAGVLNEKCRFAPHVQVVRPAAMITTSSVDPILHTTNAQVDGARTLFNVALPLPGIKINKPLGGPGIVRLSCNTHPWMRGWLVVTEDAAVVTAADGAFSLGDVPAGTYQLRVWHESLRAPPQKITVVAGQTVSVDFVLQ